MSRLRNSGSLRGKSNNYQEFDPESGTIGRKKSLVRRERARNSFNSLPSSNSLHSHLKKSDSKQSLRYNGGNSSYLDNDLTNSIPLTNLQPLNEEEKNTPYNIHTIENPMGSSSDILNDEQQSGQQQQQQQQGREYYGLNDEITKDDGINRHNSSKSNKSQNTNRSQNTRRSNNNKDDNDDDDDDENYRDDDALLKNGYYSFPNSRYRYNEAEESKKFPYWKVYYNTLGEKKWPCYR
ncbi:unnamed protein product [[Candida] boidinii]|nr:unnamed protein product [[Candida] boidinii]